MGQSLTIPNTPVEITRVASKPDMFVLRNLLPQHAQEELLKVGDSNDDDNDAVVFQNAETKSGVTSHRTKSRVAWLYKETSEVAAFLESFTTQVFLHPCLYEYTSNAFIPEPLQIAQYDVNGKFDIHHDGGGRICTILTYVNGIAGTWFPFAKTKVQQQQHDSSNDDDINDDDDRPPSITLENSKMTEGMIPGKDGIWVVGDEYYEEVRAQNGNNRVEEDDPQHIVKVQAGDAIVFYNYEYDEEYDDGTLMSWRSLHAGMPAKYEKWIVTNWIDSPFLMKKNP